MAFKKNLCHVLYLAVIFILCACSSMYIPTTTSLPLPDEKGDGQVAFSASTNSLRLSGSYAFSHKLALMISGDLSYKNFTNYYDMGTREDFVPESDWDFSDHGQFAHKYVDLGIGRYDILKKSRIFRSKLLFEIFAGIGYGHATDQKWDTLLQYKAKYYTAFIQPNIGVSFNENFTFGWGLRLADSFYDYTYQTKQNNEILIHFASFSLFTIESNLMLRVGGPRFKFIWQSGLSIPIPSKSISGIDDGRAISDGYINTTMIHLSVGIAYTFGKRKNKDAVN